MINVIILSLIYMILITLIYFSKDKIENLDNKIYKRIIVINIIGLIIDIIQFLSIKNELDEQLIYLFAKFFLLYVNAWTFAFSYYVISKNTKHSTALGRLLFTILVVTAIIGFILPVKYFYNGTEMYTYGKAIDFAYIVGNIYLGICLFSIVLDYAINKNKNLKQYIPLFIFVIGGILEIVVQKTNPSLIIVSSVETFITILMYFFIENPDMKMIEQLNIARDQADKANQAKSDFLSSMSHEIRTPLNAIVGFSEALQEEELPEKAREEVKDIVMASNSLLEIVNGILDISKIESGKIEIVNSEYNFRDIYDNLVALTKGRLGEKPLEIRTSYDESIPKVLYGDHTRVKQIILNILTNAVKYTKEGYIDFRVTSLVKDDICRLIISVEDSGIGIKQENINKLFSRFERLDIDKNITIEGTGLGLAITKKLIELMQGTIVVQSVYGKGSKFTIAIDQRIIHKEIVEDAKVEVVDSSKNVDVSGKKVLIVDDNKINLKVASRLLESYNLNIETLDSGASCLDKINSGNIYDLILMDDMMPGMSGVETLHKLKENTSFNIPIVALTANAISGMKEKYLSEGFNDYLAKPIDKEELKKIIIKYLNK